MKIFYITMGCKVNSYETAAMRQSLISAGFSDAPDKDSADIFVVNSCTVTAESDSKLRQLLRRLKRDYPGKTVVLTGCYPQAYPERARSDEYADIILGTKNRAAVAGAISEFLENRRQIVHIPDLSDYNGFESMSVSYIPDHTRAFMKIQDGCSRRCSYCIIPKARGGISSKPIADIEAEAALLAANGYSEIVLVGINLAFYGAGTGVRLPDAVRAAADIKGIERVRLSSLEPEMITDEDLTRLSQIKEFCPSFHLSLQSGCNETLAAMRRCYNPVQYEELVGKIRRTFPDCSITADVMTGFPGETEYAHEQSMDFVRKIGFSNIHVFPYSQREGTDAASMENQVPMNIRRRRAAEMSEVGAECRSKFLLSLIGKTFPVLFEKEKTPYYHNGYTPNYTYVKILTKNSEKSLRKQIFYVTIDKIENCCCVGHIVNDSHQPLAAPISR